MKMFRTKALTVFAVVLAFAAPSAFAVTGTLADLSAAVDFSTITQAILAIALLIVPVYVLWKGAKIVIRSIKGM
jgi:hypothetical protein